MNDALIQVGIPISLMVIFGLPHGALDGAIIFQRCSAYWPRTLLLFAYLCVCAVCVLLWVNLPTVCLAVFLGMSMWHFGQSDQSHSDYTVRHIWRVVSDGGIWVLLLPFSHQSAVHELFIVLGADGGVIMQTINWLIIPWSILALVNVAVLILNGDAKAAIRSLSFAVLSILMAPLWSLCIYFCAWHSRRHISRIMSDLSSPRLGWIMMISLTFITMLLALLAALGLPATMLWTAALVQVFFIGLFALTVPHMLLIDLYLPWLDSATRGASGVDRSNPAR